MALLYEAFSLGVHLEVSKPCVLPVHAPLQKVSPQLPAPNAGLAACFQVSLP